MRFRKLRIARSVAWGLVAVLLVVLWARSYWFIDLFREPVSANHAATVTSLDGRLMFARTLRKREGPKPVCGFFTTGSDTAVLPLVSTRCGFGYLAIPSGCFVTSPHWMFVGIAGAIASLPWLRFRFSLRTLLITTTLVAIVLGLIVAVV